MSYLFHILVMISYYSIIVIGLELIVSYGGIWFLGIPICSGIGSYAAVLITMKYGLHPIVGLPISVTAGLLIGSLFALLSMRLKGDIFLIVSLGACEVVSQAIKEFDAITQGAIGIMNIPPLSFGKHMQFINPGVVFILFVSILSLVVVFRNNLLTSVYRLLILGSGEDIKLSKSLGINPHKHLFTAFAIAGSFAGIAGWLSAHYLSYIDPSILSVNEAIMIFCMVIAGGIHTRWGFIVGAAIFYSMPLLIQKIGFSDSIAFHVRPILFGLTLISFMYYSIKQDRQRNNE